MKIAVLYREPKQVEKLYPLDYQGREGLRHILRVKEALVRCAHQVELVDMNENSYNYLRKAKFNFAFNLCDDGFRNNPLLEAHVPAILDILQIPYTGSNSFTLATCVNKARVKEILSFHHLPTADFQVFTDSQEKLKKTLRFPLMIKPLHEDGSIGIRKESVVKNISQLKKRVDVVLKNYFQPALAEKFIAGREVDVTILGNGDNLLAFPLSEIMFVPQLAPSARICYYEAKWLSRSQAYKNSPARCPAKLEKRLAQRLIDIAKEAYTLLGCQDYARIDFRIDKNNQPYVLEVNPNPDISEDAGLAKMAKVYGMAYDELIAKILSFALERNHLTRDGL